MFLSLHFRVFLVSRFCLLRKDRESIDKQQHGFCHLSMVFSSSQPSSPPVSMPGELPNVESTAISSISSNSVHDAVARTLVSALRGILAAWQVNTTPFSGSAALAANVLSSPAVSSPPATVVALSTAA